MNKSLFLYFTQDKSWKKKFLIGYLINIPVILFGFIVQIAKENPDIFIFSYLLYLVSVIFLGGYFARNVNLRIFKTDEIADFKPKATLLTGLKIFAATICYNLLMMTIIFAIGLLSGFFKLGLIIPVIFFVILFILYFAFILLASISFSMDLKMKSYFRFKRIKKMFNTDKKAYFYLMWKLGLYGILYFISIIVLAITIIGILFMPAANFLYLLVMNEIIADYARKTFKTIKK